MIRSIFRTLDQSRTNHVAHDVMALSTSPFVAHHRRAARARNGLLGGQAVWTGRERDPQFVPQSWKRSCNRSEASVANSAGVCGMAAAGTHPCVGWWARPGRDVSILRIYIRLIFFSASSLLSSILDSVCAAIPVCQEGLVTVREGRPQESRLEGFALVSTSMRM